jgi:uncharacterized protein (DUF433 family)
MKGTGYAHIRRDEHGKLRVADTGLKVILLLGDHVYRGMDAVELHENHPPLTLGQAHSLLAYFYDHRDEIDRELETRERAAEDLRAEIEAQQGDSLVRAKLKALGRLP